MADIEIHVLGGKKGESIIIKFSEDKWGVVDCYTSNLADPQKNPTWQFLKERGVEELEFLCLTHPHDDHYRGMLRLLNDFSIKNFWRFGTSTPEEMARILAVIAGQASLDPDPEGKEHSREIDGIFETVRQLRKTGSLKEEHLNGVKPLYGALGRDDQKGISIWSLSPSSNCISEYQDDLIKCMESERPDNVRSLRHNKISGALLIIFGETRMILGGDLEGPGWKRTLQKCSDLGISLAAHAIKVSHHGSTSGYAEGLWTAFTRGVAPYSVITPFFMHGLPTAEGINHIRQHTDQLYTTSRSAIVGDSVHDFWPDTPLAVQMASRRFLTFRRDREPVLGRCTFTFNDKGNCGARILDGDAAQFR